MNVNPNTLHLCAQQTDMPDALVGTWSSSEAVHSCSHLVPSGAEMQLMETGQTWYCVCRVMGKRRCRQTKPVYHQILIAVMTETCYFIDFETKVEKHAMTLCRYRVQKELASVSLPC